MLPHRHGSRRDSSPFNARDGINISIPNKFQQLLDADSNNTRLSSDDIISIPYISSLENFCDDRGCLLIPGKTDMLAHPFVYTRVPDLKADLVIDVFAENMSPRYTPGQRIAIEEVDKDMILFGFAYLLVLINGQKHIMYVRKGNAPDHWLLESENSRFDSREMPTDKIRQIFMIKGYVRIEVMS